MTWTQTSNPFTYTQQFTQYPKMQFFSAQIPTSRWLFLKLLIQHQVSSPGNIISLLQVAPAAFIPTLSLPKKIFIRSCPLQIQDTEVQPSHKTPCQKPHTAPLGTVTFRPYFLLICCTLQPATALGNKPKAHAQLLQAVLLNPPQWVQSLHPHCSQPNPSPGTFRS